MTCWLLLRRAEQDGLAPNSCLTIKSHEATRSFGERGRMSYGVREVKGVFGEGKGYRKDQVPLRCVSL